MPEHQDKWRLQNFDREFETGDSVRICEIAGNPNDEEIAASAVERIFRRDSGIRAAEDRGVGVLPRDEGFSFRDEVMPLGDAFLVALVSSIRRANAASGVMTFSGFGGAGSCLGDRLSLALAPPATVSVPAAAAPNIKTRRGICRSWATPGTPQTWHIR